MKLLTEKDVSAILTPDLAIESSANAYCWLSQGEANIPPRTEFFRESPTGVIFVMPGLVGNRFFGLKVIANKQDASAPDGLITTALILLLNADTLEPAGLVSADRLTDYRSAAGLAVATRALARPEASTHALYGAGKLSLPTALLISHVRPIDRLLLVSRTQARVDALAERLRVLEPFANTSIETTLGADEAAEQADIITTVTTSDTPVFDGTHLRPGTHINLAGAFHPGAREIDDAAAGRASFFVDSMESCRARAGDLVQPLANGAIKDAHIRGEIGAVLTGSIPGRQNQDEITVFKSLGNAAQDLATAQALIDQAEADGLGLSFDPLHAAAPNT